MTTYALKKCLACGNGNLGEAIACWRCGDLFDEGPAVASDSADVAGASAPWTPSDWQASPPVTSDAVMTAQPSQPMGSTPLSASPLWASPAPLPAMMSPSEVEQPIYASASLGPSGLRAGFSQRLGAYLLDSILLGVIGIAVIVALGLVGNVLALVIAVAYFVYFEGGSGQTLGKRAFGIRVVSFETGGSIGYAGAFVRYVGKIISGIFLLGFLWMLWDREKQCWHDKMASTVVVPTST